MCDEQSIDLTDLLDPWENERDKLVLNRFVWPADLTLRLREAAGLSAPGPATARN